MRRLAALGIAVALLAGAVRWPGLGDILTVDEPQWIFRSQSFYRALATGDPGATFQGTHPGVVPMLLIGGGIRLREIFSGERLGSPVVGDFRTAAKLPVALATAVGLGLAAGFAAKLWGVPTGGFIGALLAVEPFLVGHSQLAHVDALLSVLILLTLLALLLALRSSQRRWLLLSGFLAGLALLTKLPAVALVPVALAAILLEAKPFRQRFSGAALWLGTASGVFLVLWPSMWINFVPNIRYATRDAGTVVTAAHGGVVGVPPRIFEENPKGTPVLERGSPNSWFYLRALLRRASPLTLVLGVVGLYAGLLRRSCLERREASILVASILVFSALLEISGKRADRYLLPILALLTLFAGVAAARTFPWRRFRRAVPVFMVGALTLVNLVLSPYAMAFVSPFSWGEELSQSGWGEGLEQAAAVLNAHPLASELYVASWYPSVFREFFRGQTMSLSSRGDPRVAFVVLYRNMQGRPADDPATGIWEEYRAREPYAVVRVAGREVAWIYRTEALALFPAHAGEIVAPGVRPLVAGTAVEVGQFIEPDRDSLTGVRLGFATFSSRPNTNTIVFHLREDPEGPDIRTVRLPAFSLPDRGWHEIFFDPLVKTRRRKFYLAVTSSDGRPGNAVTVVYQPRDIAPGSLVLIRRALRPGERRHDFVRTGDLAYQLLYADKKNDP